jgi:phage gp45-like
VENNATFCGSGGPAGSKQVLTGGGGSRGESMMLSVDDNEKRISMKILFGAAFVFIGGYLVGRLTSGSKGLRKSE